MDDGTARFVRGSNCVESEGKFARLIDVLYREEVLEARRMSPEEKLLLGEELFEYACSITLSGIRNQNPGFSEEECVEGLQRRLDLSDRLDRSK